MTGGKNITTDRATGHYTAERLIALEDNHRAMLAFVLFLIKNKCLRKDMDIPAANITIEAEQIRRDAGLE